MKRIWFAVVFLAFAAALCVFEQTSLQSKANSTPLSMLINHQVLDDEKTNFRILRDTLQNGDGEEAAEAVRETRAGAQLVLESVRVSPANVF